MRDFFFDGHIRLDWGFGNPNVTGSLIALLAVAVWLPAFWWHWAFWLSLASSTIFGVCLVQTFSRGALIGGIVGMIPLVWGARPWKTVKVVAVCVAIASLVGYAIFLGAAKRYGHGIVDDDASVGNRWLVYQMVPRMIWDAPDGWGVGRSGEAFRQWYQPLGRLERYDHLVNSHANWLVEWGWLGRIGYVSAWVMVLHLCGLSGIGRSKWLAVPAGVWLAFGFASVFNTIFHRWLLWCVPIAFLIGVLVGRIFRREWPAFRKTVAILITGNLAFVVATAGLACAISSESRIALKQGVVYIAANVRSERKLSVLAVDQKVMGEFYGHRLREAVGRNGSSSFGEIFVVWKPGVSLPMKLSQVLLAGEGVARLSESAAVLLPQAAKVQLLNPAEPSPSLLRVLDKLPSVEILLGERYGGSGRTFWEDLAARNSRIQINTIPVAATFVSRWAEYIEGHPAEL